MLNDIGSVILRRRYRYVMQQVARVQNRASAFLEVLGTVHIIMLLLKATVSIRVGILNYGAGLISRDWVRRLLLMLVGD